MRISSTGIALESEGGDVDVASLLDSLAKRPARVALDSHGFVPVWTGFFGPVRLDTGYSLGAVLFEATGASPLVELLAGSPLEPGTSYALDVRSAADFSLGLRATTGMQIKSRVGTILPSVSVLLPVSIAHAEATAGISIDTDGRSLPSAAEMNWAATYWRAGNGIGLGMTMDAGIALRVGRILAGIGLDNLISAWYAKGAGLGSDAADDGPVRISEIQYGLVPIVSLLRSKTGAAGTALSLAFFGAYRDGIVGSVAATLEQEGISVVIGGGFDRGLRLGLGLGFEIGLTYIEPSVEVRTDAVTSDLLVGLALQAGRRSPRPGARQ